MMTAKEHKISGFTLVELLIAMAVSAFLLAARIRVVSLCVNDNMTHGMSQSGKGLVSRYDRGSSAVGLML